MGPLYPTLHYLDDPTHRMKPRFWHPEHGWGAVINVWSKGFDVSFREAWEKDPTPGGAHLVRFDMEDPALQACVWENINAFCYMLREAKRLEERWARRGS